jgi:hypothetical protein
MRKGILFSILFFSLVISALNAQPTGTLKGDIKISAGKENEFSRIVIREYTTKSVIQGAISAITRPRTGLRRREPTWFALSPTSTT